MSEAPSLQQVIQALLTAADTPLSTEKLGQLLDDSSAQGALFEKPDGRQIKAACEALQEEMSGSALELVRVASGWRIQVRELFSPWVSRLFEERPQKYSRALLETLAIIAYRQPVTRGEIEEVRGVSVSTNIARTLLERGWVRVVGHREVPGRPALYGTTKEFLDYFNLKNLSDLPELAELKDIGPMNDELELPDPMQELVEDELSSAAESDSDETEKPEAEYEEAAAEAFAEDKPQPSDTAESGKD